MDKQRKALAERLRVQPTPEVGTLCKIAPWCKNKGRLVHVVETLWWDKKTVVVQYMDPAGMKVEPSKVAVGNLITLFDERVGLVD